MSCRLVHYRAENIFARNPLSEMLASIEISHKEVSKNYKDIFDLLVTKENYISLKRNFIASMANDQDVDGNSALHHAARLSDPYFYEKLMTIGDIYLPNNEGVTPDELFSRKALKARP